jgi:hypothetical protein
VSEADEAPASFISSQSETYAVLQAAKEIFDQMALGEALYVPDRWIDHATLWWDVRRAALCGEVAMQLDRDIAAVEYRITRWNVSEQRAGIAQISMLSWAWDEPRHLARAVHAGVQLAAQPAARAGKALRLGAAVCGP